MQVNGVWRVTRDAANERERRARVWLAVSRALGDIGLKEPSPLVVCTPEIRTERLADDDLFLVLACDGVRLSTCSLRSLGPAPCGSVVLVLVLDGQRRWLCVRCGSVLFLHVRGSFHADRLRAVTSAAF
jgi:ribosomal protein S27AE